MYPAVCFCNAVSRGSQQMRQSRTPLTEPCMIIEPKKIGSVSPKLVVIFEVSLRWVLSLNRQYAYGSLMRRAPRHHASTDCESKAFLISLYKI